MTLPRIVATDLDGTLLTSSGTVTARTRRALRLARDAGAEIVFVTARAPRGVDAVAERAGVTGTAVCSNGAIVYDLATREIVECAGLALAVARQVAEVLREALPGLAFAIETGRGVLAEPGYGRQVPGDEPYRRQVADLWAHDGPIAKLLVWSARHHADEMIEAATAVAGGLAEITHSGAGGLLEISAPGVTKAATLAALCRERGVDPQEVVAFGDMPNDLAVLAFAGRGYAMANAHPLVLAAARCRTASNDEDGVAAALEYILGCSPIDD
ncbi:HAD-IIB family hydrolase [Thermoactinospora rubra]|uniref:HAD-IIB family hydrolase n=1 Tax=Thermoactinospora rubra TaxID=1088767 RepID=UPI00197F3184|nr:HAD-IIB family hydrolase [Thermoactinospora rubra]